MPIYAQYRNLGWVYYFTSEQLPSDQKSPLPAQPIQKTPKASSDKLAKVHWNQWAHSVLEWMCDPHLLLTSSLLGRVSMYMPRTYVEYLHFLEL
ncbi:hypothetical protein FOPE_09176 [Fonsecaea pedrosoi]|nr:hypothetical protein FOPE_09176 [Fonsecaea pedrosoi]